MDESLDSGISSLRSTIEELFLKEIGRHRSLFMAIYGILEGLADSRRESRVFAGGGVIRDLAVSILENRPFRMPDLDLVVEGIGAADVEVVLERVLRKSSHITSIDRVGRSFSVWKIKVRDFPVPIDLALTRTERSFGSGHRDFEISTEGVSIEEDSSSRDFRMNALFVDLRLDEENRLSARLQDFHGGLQSIVGRRIECVGDPQERFREDPLRMLRAIRFRARLPGFEIAHETSVAIKRLVPVLLGTVSKERIAEELFKSIAANPEMALSDLVGYGVLEQLFPDFLNLGQLAVERTTRRLRQFVDNGRVFPSSLFAAFLFEIALKETEAMLRGKLSLARIDSRRFSAAGVNRISRQARLPDIRQMTQLSKDALCLIHFDLLENADAVLEEILSRYEGGPHLLSLYNAHQLACGEKPLDFMARAGSLPPTRIDYARLMQNSGIPFGPHLQEIKLRLRQLEIEGAIGSEMEARSCLNRFYMEDTYLIREHASKLAEYSGKVMPPRLQEEIRWLLFTRPIRLIQAYIERGILPAVFPELTAAEEAFEPSRHHFLTGYLNKVTMALSLLYEETADPLPVHILSILFLDIGKSATRQTATEGRVTYYGHGPAGADMALDICRRLAVDEAISNSVHFIIANHDLLLSPIQAAKGRIRRLLKKVDEGLVSDLLLIYKIDQLSKMKIQNGRRVEQGELDTYRYIQSHLDEWRAEILEEKSRRLPSSGLLLSGEDLMSDHPEWGIGLLQGRVVGRIKRYLAELQEQGVVKSREEAVRSVRGKIVLHHLLNQPVSYLETLRERGLLTRILPEVAGIVGLEQPGIFHAEDVYTHTLSVLRALPEGSSKECTLAAVFHDVGKATTQTFDGETGSSHFYGHEKVSAELFQKVFERFGWQGEGFDGRKVLWLIRNHLLSKTVDWENVDNPLKTARRLFFGKEGEPPIPPDYRYDFVVLSLADAMGAEPEDAPTREKVMARETRFSELVREVEEDLKRKEQERLILEKIHRLWNGRLVIRHFQAEGREIGRLLRIGQDHVRGRLARGDETISEAEIIEHIQAHLKGSERS